MLHLGWFAIFFDIRDLALHHFNSPVASLEEIEELHMGITRIISFAKGSSLLLCFLIFASATVIIFKHKRTRKPDDGIGEWVWMETGMIGISICWLIINFFIIAAYTITSHALVDQDFETPFAFEGNSGSELSRERLLEFWTKGKDFVLGGVVLAHFMALLWACVFVKTICHFWDRPVLPEERRTDVELQALLTPNGQAQTTPSSVQTSGPISNAKEPELPMDQIAIPPPAYKPIDQSL
ncbi:MAG: hypothetical protein M1820_001801 [Bogoriella megaspora]|nr:MAG: hypothetical protein M1820_001801 [Bogoriella megaspora]